MELFWKAMTSSHIFHELEEALISRGSAFSKDHVCQRKDVIDLSKNHVKNRFIALINKNRFNFSHFINPI